MTALLKRMLVSLLLALTTAAPAYTATTEAENDKVLEGFKLKGLDGAMHNLAQWKGKVILLNFWASWCASCQAEIRDFIQFQTEFGTQGLQIIGLGLDEEHKLHNVGRTLGINYPVLVANEAGANGRLLAAWGNPQGVVPYTVVIDRQGKPAYIHHGPMDREVFRDHVAPLLGEY